MQPHPVDLGQLLPAGIDAPSLLQCFGEQHAAQPSSGSLWEEAEIEDFYFASVLGHFGHQLHISLGSAVLVEHPRFGTGTSQDVFPLLPGQTQTVSPVQLAAHALIKEA